RVLVRLFQAMFAALMTGGRPFVEVYISDFQTLRSSLIHAAESHRSVAESIKQSLPGQIEEMTRGGWALRRRTPGAPFLSEVGKYPGAEYFASKETERDKRFEQAARLEKYADELNTYCQFVRTLSIIQLRGLRAVQ